MIIKELNVVYSLTRSLGNYESVKAQAGITVIIDKDDDPDEVYDTMWEIVTDEVNDIIKEEYGEK